MLKQRVLSLALVLIVICSSTPLAAEAQANNTLEWGVDVGEEFTYVMQRAYFADPSYIPLVVGHYSFVSGMIVGEKAILRIVSLNEIPMLINESSQMPQSLCNLERANDSVPIISGLQDFVYPIGDWDFIVQMNNLSAQEGITLIDTAEEWGFTGATTLLFPDNTVVANTIELRYEKENGTLNYMRLRYSTLGTDLIDIIIVNWHSGMPTIVSEGIQTTTILIVAIASVVGIIVFIIVYQGYRSKKPVVQKLGE